MANLNITMESLNAQFAGLKDRHPGQWPLIPRVLCAVGVMLAVIAAGYYGYWSGQLEEQEQNLMRENVLKEEYKVKIQQAVNLDALRDQKKQVLLYVNSLEKQLPGKAQMDALLRDINTAGSGRGLSFDLFKPGQPLVKEYYSELPIDIKVSGSYHDIGAFTGDIANLSRIVTLNNLSLSTNKDGGLILEAIAKTFRYLDPEELAAGRKIEQDKKKGAKK
jgi:type IV pilus assembly protein PilO